MINKKIGNYLFKFLKKNEKILFKIEELLLWHRFIPSLIFLIFIELIFLFFYFLNLKNISNIILIIYIYLIIKLFFEYFPNKLEFILNIPNIELPENSLHRIRTSKEITAYFIAILSYFNDFFQLLLEKDLSYLLKILNLLILMILIILIIFIGDFWFLWILIHFIFIFPGIIIQPRFQSWYFDENNDLNYKTLPISDEKIQSE